jgi:hypothetical protein
MCERDGNQRQFNRTERDRPHLTGVGLCELLRMRPVICITTNSVRIEPMVTASPVKPLKKKA